ncbi:MAG: phosphoesterase [Dissulfuribacterales bacterium]
MKFQQILCIHRKSLIPLFGTPLFSDIRPSPPSLQDVLRLPFEFVNREQAEVNDNLKQLIPYVIIRHQDRFFVYKREKRVKEGRLAGLKSIGIGGHIDREDAESTADAHAIYEKAMRRELAEELKGAGQFSFPRFLGWINDESNAVGRVHLGAVHVLEMLNADGLGINHGEHLTHLGWMTAQEVINEATTFETWSVFAAKLAIISTP